MGAGAGLGVLELEAAVALGGGILMVEEVFFVDETNVALLASELASEDVKMAAKMLDELFGVVLECNAAHYAGHVLPGVDVGTLGYAAVL
jgi:hypothetical protein